MDFNAIAMALESSALGTGIRNSLVLFPFIEAAHVIGLTLVFGTIMIVDLRLLGLASSRRTYNRLASELLRWTWAAFALTLVTGLLMMVSGATVYFANTYFQIKMALLLLAGLNMLVFQFTIGKVIDKWQEPRPTPPMARAAGVLSLVLWISVIIAGRLIGFTTTGATPVEPPPAGVDFEDFLS